MSFRIERCTPDDGPQLTRIGHAAFKDDLLNKSGLPENITEEQDLDYLAWREQSYAERFAGPNRHYYKAVEEGSGDVVGFAGWFGPVPASEAPKGPRWPTVPSFLDQAYYENIEARFKEAKKRIMGDRDDYWFLQSLAVHPAFQGRGVGGLLVQHACDNLIDKEGRDCYLESSTAGRKLYLKFGFEKVDEVPFLDGKYVSHIMVRRARPQTNGANS